MADFYKSILPEASIFYVKTLIINIISNNSSHSDNNFTENKKTKPYPSKKP